MNTVSGCRASMADISLIRDSEKFSLDRNANTSLPRMFFLSLYKHLMREDLQLKAQMA